MLGSPKHIDEGVDMRIPRPIGRGSIGAAIAVALPVIAGCGTPAPDASGGEVRISNAFGTATVRSAPQRVVALSTTDADLLFAVGVTPLAVPVMPQVESATGGTGVYPWQRDHYPAGTPTLSAPADAPDLEAVAALRPDLIVATTYWGLDEKSYAALSRIAPVVAFDKGTNADSWQSSVRKVGTAVGRPDRAAQSISDAEAALQAQADAHSILRGKRYSAVISPGQSGVFTLCSAQDNLARALSALGLILAEHPQSLPCDGGKTKVPWEQVSRLDADLLWVIPDDAAQVGVLDAQPIWRQTPAVQRGAIAVVPKTDGVPFALGFPSPLSLQWGVGQIAPKLAAAAAH